MLISDPFNDLVHGLDIFVLHVNPLIVIAIDPIVFNKLIYEKDELLLSQHIIIVDIDFFEYLFYLLREHLVIFNAFWVVRILLRHTRSEVVGLGLLRVKFHGDIVVYVFELINF